MYGMEYIKEMKKLDKSGPNKLRDNLTCSAWSLTKQSGWKFELKLPP